MNATAIVWPLIAHVVLVYAVYGLLSLRRFSAVKAGSATNEQFRDNVIEPAESRYVRNNLQNQFELPVLFHSVCLALLVTEGVSGAMIAMAWIFVASRCAHAWMQVTSNRIRHRSPFFMVGFLALALMWLWLGLHLLGGV
ncbi:MAPEG family protein [Mesorhizobium xinjiangense]|uniref:MAPEG family protein n=1 Tax=Mesorhizobium xinjiangense TaxID=2678685 RepID=UPI0012EE3416|nr:MAPEG family protein [Mesorhizobium xinjiangense]